MQLKLLSANIRFASSSDGDHHWDNRRPHLSKIINDFLPDILATQEGRQPQILSLHQEIALTLVDSHRSWIEDRMYPCLFINEELMQILGCGDIWLSETPMVGGSSSFNSAFPRLCIWAEVFHLGNHQEYFIVNTHLDHVLESTRIEQIKVLLKEISLINKKNLPVIVMGDFNTSPSSEVRNLLINRFDLKDPWLEKLLHEETSHHGFKGSQATGDRIDWILVPKNFLIDEIKMEKSHFNSIYPSDHYPILATVIPR